MNTQQLRTIHAQACAAVARINRTLSPVDDRFWPLYLNAVLAVIDAMHTPVLDIELVRDKVHGNLAIRMWKAHDDLQPGRHALYTGPVAAPNAAQALVTCSEALHQAIEQGNPLAAGVAFGLALLARERGFSGPADLSDADHAPIAEVVSAYGDPEAFGERELVARADLSKIPFGTKLYAAPVALAAVAQQLAVNADDLDFTPDEQHSIHDMANIGKALLERVASMCPDDAWNESPTEIVSDLINERDDARADCDRIRHGLAKWATERWNAEVRNRPLVNVHRRALDDTWRQVIRHCGADDVALLGQRHGDLVAADAKQTGPDRLPSLSEVHKHAQDNANTPVIGAAPVEQNESTPAPESGPSAVAQQDEDQ
ncbi:hypothetical protein AB4Y40_30140 [Paraburkholderia sp. EG287B]|uniref:hypothetical protein n=1 Tax=Paraburkholderia sp. EG287B TaxID=3237010 RepID=UPI0034D1BA3B